MAGYAAIRGYFVDLVARKTREPGGDDLLSALVAVRDEGERLDEDELLGMAWLLLTAGHRTTVDLVGSGTLALLRHPDQHAALRADPGRLPAAIEEMLRYDGPIELGISRFTTEEITIGGVTIPGGGEVVILAIGAADRDPDRFADPDLFQTHRDQTGHLAFGHGIHYCLGAPLARMEAGIALRILLDRCADLSLAVDPDHITWQVNPHLRGPAALPVRFTPLPGRPVTPRGNAPGPGSASYEMWYEAREPVARESRGVAMTAAGQHLEVVVGDDGAVRVPAPEVARLGARPGEHLQLVREGFSPVRRGRAKVRGILVGKIDSADLLTEQDFDDARRARVEAAERRFGPAE